MPAFLKTTAQANPSATSMMKVLAVGLLAGLISACGGGGGGDGPAVSELSFPLEKSATAHIKSSRTDNLSGSNQGTNFSAVRTRASGPPGMFQGFTRLTSTSTTIFRINGAVFSQDTNITYFSENPLTTYGSISQDGTYIVDEQAAYLPTTAKIGAIGNLGTSIRFSDGSLSNQIGSATTTWSLEPDTATTALFCFNFVVLGSTPGTGSDCYRINQNGDVLGIVVKVTVNGITLTFK